MKKFLLGLYAAAALACGGINLPPIVTPPPVDPPPIEQPPVEPPAPTTVIFDGVACTPGSFVQNYCPGIKGATFAIEVAPNVWNTYKGNDAGYFVTFDFPNIPDSRITIAAPGYVTLGPIHFDVTNAVANSGTVCDHTTGDHCHNHWDLQPVAPPFPPPPTRDQVLNIRLQAQGLTVDTEQFGTLPWWEAALTYLNPADRARVYAAKHAATAWGPGGDTHGIIAVPSGRALYDEPGQPYSADRFPPLDWTNGHTKMVPEFNALVIEMIQNGFTPMIFLDETYSTSMATLPIVIDALQHSSQGDLTRYVIILPGWDGVFYGWEPSHTVIPGWASLARSSCPNCYLGIEHNVGHIPLGEGPSDWVPGGLMNGFDVLLSEFFDGVFDDTVWQIAGRTIGLVSKGGTYVRPPDQPASDDPNPPYYMQGNTRDAGHQKACAFEFAMYGWVRGRSSAADVNGPWRQYFKNIGYTCGG